MRIRVKIGTKLTAMFLILCILPTVILGFYAYRRTFKELQRGEVEKYNILLEGIVSNTRTTLNDTEFLLKNLANNAAFTQLLNLYNNNAQTENTLALRETNNMLRKIYVDSMGYYESVFLVGLDGNIVADSLGRTGYSLGVTDLQFVKDAMNTRGFVMSNVYMSALSQTGVDLPTVSMAYPIIEGTGQVYGAIVITFDFSNFDRVVRNTNIGQSGYGFMLRRSGEVISHPDGTILLKKADDPISLSILEKVQGGEVSGVNHIRHNKQKWSYFYRAVPNTNWVIAFTIPEKEYLTVASQIRNNTLIIIFISILIAVLVSIVFVKKQFTRYIEQMATTMKKIAKGDFTVVSECNSGDEFEELSDSINEMTRSQSKVLSELIAVSNSLKEAGENMTQSSDEAQAYMDEIAATAQQFLASAQESKGVVIGIEESIDAVMHKSDEVEKISVNAVKESNSAQVAASVGVKAIEKAMSTMEHIDKSVSETVKDVKHLVEDSNTIREFVDYIKGIAQQTNLLALNAAIESARAGEAGRGFGVVAEEVRKLSQQSNEASEKISNIIENILKRVDIVNKKIQNAQKHSNEGKIASEDVRHQFSDILKCIHAVSNLIEKTSIAAKDQVISTKKVQEYMIKIDEMLEYTLQGAKQMAQGTQSQAQMMEDISSTASELNLMAIQLKETASQFKIDNKEDVINYVEKGEDIKDIQELQEETIVHTEWIDEEAQELDDVEEIDILSEAAITTEYNEYPKN
ncbi:methyl-accepting chemotaxis protein [Alkalithermobacter paradoxus]|uniref:Methyl-accepting chemotaxis protein McpB n=1 Tax=Alkalithermobacter paradoxus TaxID=29349 RepID=A0A1V4I601_9FIRM|nr:methyl-accepting chemotaxis protein McpB [[Clostridium] thermoalcaliphilum]